MPDRTLVVEIDLDLHVRQQVIRLAFEESDAERELLVGLVVHKM